MDGTASARPFEARQTEAFGHDALTGKGGVAMQQHRQHAGAVFVIELILFGAGFPQDHRINRFQVRRVGRQRQMNFVAVELTIR